LPVRAPEQLAVFRWSSGPVSVFESLNGNAQRDERDFSVSSTSFSRPAFEAMRGELSDRAEVFGFADLYRLNLSVDGRADVGNGHVVSGNYYSALGLSAAAGRLITTADDRPDAPHVAVISHAAWQRRFGGVSVIGKQMALNGIPFTVIGVAPAGFHGTAQVAQEFDVIVPMSAYDAVNRSTQAASPNYWWILVMARLRPGVRLDQVQPAADLIGLYGLLAYSVSRRTPELGLRMALGADRGTVRWMVLRQSLILVGTGLAIGIPSAIGSSRFVSSLLFEISPSSPLALTAAAAIMLAVSLLAAFIPAHRASRVEPAIALRAE
jgi:MacB-like periplasmic core domain/FtsX-like permease family